MEISDEEVEEVVQICQAYETGYNAGRMNLSVDTNPYIKKDKYYMSWMFGHNVGIQIELMDLDEGWIN